MSNGDRNDSVVKMEQVQNFMRTSSHLNWFKRIKVRPYHFSMFKLVFVLVMLEMMMACLLCLIVGIIFPSLIQWSTKAWSVVSSGP